MRQIKQQDEHAGFPTPIAAHLQSIRQAITKRQETEQCEKGNGKGHTSAEVLHLFAAVQGKGRTHIENRLITSVNGIRIKYTGGQLEQSDLDVWEQVLHLARQSPLGTVCQFKAGSFLKSIGRSRGKANYTWLSLVLSRLTACEVRFERPGFTHGRGLIASYDIDEHSRLYCVCVDPDVAKLYRAGWSAIDWQQRQALKRKPLAL